MRFLVMNGRRSRPMDVGGLDRDPLDVVSKQARGQFSFPAMARA